MRSTRDPWFLWPIENDPQMRLVCFPFAGAGGSAFHPWRARFQALGVELVPVQLPGRETRLAEALIDDAATLAHAVAIALEGLTDRPMVFFGYSLGALLAFEVARELRRRGAAQPAMLLVGAAIAPQQPDPVPRLSHLEGDAFLDAVRRYLDTSSEVWEHPELVELLAPVLRNDLRVVENYEYVDEAPLDFPIRAFTGADDDFVTRSDVEAWGVHTSATFDLRVLPGGHFFINESAVALQDAIAQDIATLASL